MFDYLKHISPNTKILFVAFLLILFPGAIISYLSLQSINQNAENLKTKYVGSVNLVRDKLESEILQVESNLRNRFIELFPNPANEVDLKALLRNIESENPAFKHLFLVNTDGGLTSSSVSFGWEKTTGSRPLMNPMAAANFNLAEKAEFIAKDYRGAAGFYGKALASAASSQERALLLSRRGRCYFKLQHYEKGIAAYQKILELRNVDITVGEVPASIVARSQITNGYKALKNVKEHCNALLELYQQLLDHPWDLYGGEYSFYLKAAHEEIQKLDASNINSTERSIEEQTVKGNELLEQIGFIELIHKNILPEIAADLKQGSLSELQSQHISREENNSITQLGFLKLPAAFQQSQLVVLGYQFEKEYFLSNLFPKILTSVELGRDVFVGILGENDSLLYLQQNLPTSNYLVAENFTHLFVNWKVALFDQDGRSIEQLSGNEKQLYLILFAGIIIVMLIGIVVMVRAVIHESEISRMKSEFVSNVSHELKTPLALIRMFGETLDEGIVKDEKRRREFYSIIRKESERLTHLIDNVLDFSRMDSGAKKYHFEEADLVNVVRSSLEAYKFHIRDNGFEIQSELPDESILLKIDKDAISQTLLNLLSNAVRYSKKEKFILVKVGRNSTSALISVTDHGVGIAKQELKNIFNKFYQVPIKPGEESRGSGLGLALVKHIVTAHDGTIEVESELGQGSTFTVKIPLLRTTSQ